MLTMILILSDVNSLVEVEVSTDSTQSDFPSIYHIYTEKWKIHGKQAGLSRATLEIPSKISFEFALWKISPRFINKITILFW